MLLDALLAFAASASVLALTVWAFRRLRSRWRKRR